MEKRFIQDIKKVSREQVKQSIPRSEPLLVPASKKNPAIDLPKEVPFTPSRPQNSSKHGLWIIAVICIVALIASLSYLFETATVIVTPKTIPVALDATDMFTADKDSTDPDALSYTVMSLSGDTSIVLPTTEDKDVANYATGKVTLYNTYSSSPFKIVKGTQLKAPNGLLYKVNDLVYIPGYSKAIGGNIAGSIEVSITALNPGEDSNITDNSNFTIPYFAKRPQNGKVYARSKAPISGGLTGKFHTVPQDTADAAYQTLKDKLRASLIAKTKVQVPDGYLFFDGATIFTTDDSVVTSFSKDTQIPLALHGKLTSYLIKQDSLVKNIVTKFVSNYNDEPVTIPKISSLSFVLPSDKALDPDNDKSVTFSLDGTTKILWTVNGSEIKSLLAGRSKSTLNDILTEATGIDKIDVVIKPFWKGSFPSDQKRIAVDVLNPTN